MSNEIPPVSQETQDCIDDLGAALESMVDITTAISKEAWETEAPTSAAELVELDEIILCARNVLDATSKFRSHNRPYDKCDHKKDRHHLGGYVCAKCNLQVDDRLKPVKDSGGTGVLPEASKGEG